MSTLYGQTDSRFCLSCGSHVSCTLVLSVCIGLDHFLVYSGFVEKARHYVFLLPFSVLFCFFLFSHYLHSPDSDFLSYFFAFGFSSLPTDARLAPSNDFLAAMALLSYFLC